MSLPLLVNHSFSVKCSKCEMRSRWEFQSNTRGISECFSFPESDFLISHSGSTWSQELQLRFDACSSRRPSRAQILTSECKYSSIKHSEFTTNVWFDHVLDISIIMFWSSFMFNMSYIYTYWCRSSGSLRIQRKQTKWSSTTRNHERAV